MAFDPNWHYVYYYVYENRACWECQTCSSAGSVPDYGDPEMAAAESHKRVGITNLGITNKRLWGANED